MSTTTPLSAPRRRRRRTYLLAGLVVLAVAVLWARRVPSGPVTPVGDVPVATGWKVETVLSGLEHPWGMAWLPNGDLLVTEKAGRLRVVRAGRLQETPIAGLPTTLSSGHGGLMDVVLHPRFSENRWIYLTAGVGSETANSTQVFRGRLSPNGDALTELSAIHVVQPLKAGLQHFGSRLLWLPDGTLLLALGDGGNPPNRIAGELSREQAQLPGSQLGKILRLHDDGRIPSDNPFVGRAGYDPAIYSLGHRNIQGLVRDASSGRIWATEHGSRGGDELNLITPGGNYGWPRATYSIEYTFGTISRHNTRAGMIDPVAVWTPAQAPSGLLHYTGAAFPAWRGDLFSGALKRQEIRRISLDDQGRPKLQEKIPIGERVRDVRQGPDGLIYALTDEANGRLLRLVPAP